MIQPAMRLGDLLIKKGWLSQERLDQALREQKASRKFLGSILVEQRFITERQLVQILSEQFRMPCVSLANCYVDWELVAKFSSSLISEQKCFPLSDDGSCVTFAITNPLDALAMGEAGRQAKNRAVKFVLALQSEMDELLGRYRKEINVRIRHSLDDLLKD